MIYFYSFTVAGAVLELHENSRKEFQNSPISRLTLQQKTHRDLMQLDAKLLHLIQQVNLTF